MSRQPDTNEERGRRPADDGTRERLLAGMALTDRRWQLAGVHTAVLEGGDGPPMVLLHGAGEFAATWIRVIPELMRSYRVVVPDLPGHGASDVADDPLNADRVLGWLDELIEQCCVSAPVLVGHLLGGAIAARFAAGYGDRVSELVLVDTFGLARLRPSPRFALALIRFIARPTERSQDRLFRQCMVDLDGVREQMGDRWALMSAYALERSHAPNQNAAIRSLMHDFGGRIAAEDLTRIAVPTTLIWGRHDRQVRLRVAESASARHGWPLHVIDHAADDPAAEQPEAFVSALAAALAQP